MTYALLYIHVGSCKLPDIQMENKSLFKKYYKIKLLLLHFNDI